MHRMGFSNQIGPTHLSLSLQHQVSTVILWVPVTMLNLKIGPSAICPTATQPRSATPSPSASISSNATPPSGHLANGAIIGLSIGLVTFVAGMIGVTIQWRSYCHQKTSTNSNSEALGILRDQILELLKGKPEVSDGSGHDAVPPRFAENENPEDHNHHGGGGAGGNGSSSQGKEAIGTVDEAALDSSVSPGKVLEQ